MTIKGTTPAVSPTDHHHSPTPSPPSTSTPPDTTTWAPAPPFLLPDPDVNARIARRNANHHMYRSFGTNTIWHKYLELGYYVFDDCMDFQRAWKSTAKEALSNRYKIIWKSFHIHRMHDIPINDNLQTNAINTVRPFLTSHDPDMLLATDIEFEEKQFFANKELGTPMNNSTDESEWTEVINSKKNKKKTPPSSPTLSPPMSPKIAHHTPGTTELFDSPDDALLEISLTPQKVLQQRPTEAHATHNEGIIRGTSPVQHQQVNTPTHNQDTETSSVFNPYTKAHITLVRTLNTHSSRKHRSPGTAPHTETPTDITTPTQPATMPPSPSQIHNPNHNDTTQTTQTSIAFTDPPDDASTQATNTTHDTVRQQGTSTTRSIYSQVQQTNAHIPINDGTLRITVRWKPHNYDEITREDHIWQDQAIKMLKDILHHPLAPISLVPWQQAQVNHNSMTKITLLTPDIFTTIRSPKISHLDSYGMTVFGIRICATDPAFSTGTWLKDSTVQASLEKHRVELNISNSTCNSGRMVIAGAILLKHPQFTHRLYFLLALRRILPTHTPFFDIGIHQRTHGGIESPHLVVKCGENHQEALTEILSNFMDGKQTTAIYIGTQVLQSMTQEATEDLFDTHQKYVNSIQRLPLSPQIVNIDRVRDEHNSIGASTYSRSTRAWANSLVTPEGKPLQCDAENGGRDKKAYLLVPAHLVSVVQPLLQQYKQSIRVPRGNDSHREADITTERPNEIYVPTESVQRNVDFLRHMSSASIWKNAPSTIRQGRPPHSTPAKGAYSSADSNTTKQPTSSQKSYDASNIHAHSSTPIRQGNPTTTPHAHGNTFPPIRSPPHPTTHHRFNNQTFVRQLDDNTTATFHSTASTTLNSSHNAHRFAELEASIKANKLDLTKMNTQYATTETRLLETMTACHDNSKQLVVMQGQLNSLQNTMQVIAEQMNQITNHFAQSERQRDAEQSTLRSPAKKKPRKGTASPNTPPTQLDTDLESSPHQRGLASPPTILNHDDHINDDINTIADSEDAQYTQPSSPSTAMEE